jgi:subtilisin family serine protease
VQRKSQLRLWSMALVCVTALPWAAGAAMAQTAAIPPPPAIAPQLPDMSEVDGDGNGIDDSLDRELGDLRQRSIGTGGAAAAAKLTRPVSLKLAFAEPITQAQLDAFVALGGEITYVFQELAYGWIGRLPRDRIEALPAAMGRTLVGVFPVRSARPALYEATQRGRTRPIWASGFAGNPLGYQGNADTTIAIVDSGVDDTHPDLAGRMAWWKDYTPTSTQTAHDNLGHGTMVAGVALGSGDAFGVGPAPLTFTPSWDFYQHQPGRDVDLGFHLPANLLTVTRTAVWVGPGTLALGTRYAPDGFEWDSVDDLSLISAPTSGPSGVTHVDTFTPLVDNLYRGYVEWSGDVRNVAVVSTVSTFGPVGDGFNAFRGVAPGCRWGGAKVIRDRTGATIPGQQNDQGDIEAGSLEMALDDISRFRVQGRVKVVNLSLSIIDGGTDPMSRAVVNSLVAHGVVVTAAAGNGGNTDAPGVGDPGRAAYAITVGSSNSQNQLTGYTSIGAVNIPPDTDLKPDLIAPGGSGTQSALLMPDSNDNDAFAVHNGVQSKLPDQVPDDYTIAFGTSFATPFVSGAAALVIDALEQNGLVWDFSSGVQPFLVKVLLLAGATETNLPKAGERFDLPLGRAAQPKDNLEGYGLINPDASVEAAVVAYRGGVLSDATNGGLNDRRAWGRKLELRGGVPVELTLNVASTADFDLYLYDGGTPAASAKGNPIILTASTHEQLGEDESIRYLPPADGTAYLFVKRVSGRGSWALCETAVNGACPCPGDCDTNGAVTIDDLLQGIAIALGTRPVDACGSLDGNGDGVVTVDEILRSAHYALAGCPGR